MYIHYVITNHTNITVLYVAEVHTAILNTTVCTREQAYDHDYLLLDQNVKRSKMFIELTLYNSSFTF